jgi:hypothetical protein
VVSDLIDSYGSSVAFIGYHGGDPLATDRIAYYPFFAGYPTYLIDGHIDSWHGSPQWDYWDDDTDARLLVTTDVTLDLAVAPGATPEEREITATVCIEAGGTGKSMRMYLAEILDDYPPDPPPPQNFKRNGIRQMAATQDIVLAADACTDVSWTLTLDATSMASLEEMSFISWAQDDLAAGPAEVFQAIQLNWPLTSPRVFTDDFESGDFSGWSEVVP